MYTYKKIDQLVVLIHLKKSNYPFDLDHQVELLQVQHIDVHLHLQQLQLQFPSLEYLYLLQIHLH